MLSKKINQKKIQKTEMSTSTILSKFKKKNTDVLDEMYNNRNEKIKGGGSGKGRSIFNQEYMEELGLEEINPASKNLKGENYFEILPISFNEDEPYFVEVPVHKSVGPSFDDFICMKKYRNESCYRCSKQKELYKKSNNETTNEIKGLFPSDRVIYLVWWRTSELSEEVKEQERIEKISILNAPKNKFHSEIMEQITDKKKKRKLDISDPSPDGDGRTIYYKMKYVEKFPNYIGFTLLERDEEGLPDAIIEKLGELIEYAQDHGKRNIIECLLEFHSDDELKDAMRDEVFSDSDETKNNKKEKLSLKNKKNKQKEEEDEENEEEIDLDELKETLEEKSIIKVRFWAKSKGLGELVESITDKDEMIEVILTYYKENAE